MYSKEFYIYGSQRLGYIGDNVFLGRKCIGKFCNIVANPVNTTPFIDTQKTLPPVVIQPIGSSSVGVVFGKKRYEISDWLGNVRVVINDRKTPINSGGATADVISSLLIFYLQFLVLIGSTLLQTIYMRNLK